MALTKVASNLNGYKNNLAMTYKYLGKYDQALEEINEALKAEPDQANALDTKGDILVCLGRYAEAVPFLIRLSASGRKWARFTTTGPGPMKD
jgi:tetratricopeptide (TPR) repeat protein